MKVFISYSLNDAEQYILSILAKRLKEQGYVVSTGYNINSTFRNDQNISQINNSNLFIGLITTFGNANDKVIQEWQYARTRKIPSLLLTENTVWSISPQYANDPNIIRFDRNNPEPSIESVRRRIETSRSMQENNDSAWLIGGLAILALIGLLADED